MLCLIEACCINNFVLLQVSQWYNLVVFTASLEVSHALYVVVCAKFSWSVVYCKLGS